MLKFNSFALFVVLDVVVCFADMSDLRRRLSAAQEPKEWANAENNPIGSKDGYVFKSQKSRHGVTLGFGALMAGAAAGGIGAATALTGGLSAGAGVAIANGVAYFASQGARWRYKAKNLVHYKFRQGEYKNEAVVLVRIAVVDSICQDGQLVVKTPQFAVLRRINDVNGGKKRLKFVFTKLQGGRVCDRYIYYNGALSEFLGHEQLKNDHLDGKKISKAFKMRANPCKYLLEQIKEKYDGGNIKLRWSTSNMCEGKTKDCYNFDEEAATYVQQQPLEI